MALLLQGHKVELNKPDKEGNTALHYAALNGQLKIAYYLLMDNADFSQKNSTGKTAEDIAVDEKEDFILHLFVC